MSMLSVNLHNLVIRIVSRFISSKQIRRKFNDIFRDQRDDQWTNHAYDMGPNLGRHSYLGEGCIVYHKDTKVGSFCAIAHNVLIGAGKHPLDFFSIHPFIYSANPLQKNDSACFFESYLPVEIGNDVWIGSNVVIMDEVKIGDGAVIGSNAVVTKDVPPYAILVGVPAKIIRYRFDSEKITKLLKLKWWELEDKYLLNIPYDNVDECIELISAIERK